MKTVTIYTDGACSGNPGPGGWGAILEYQGVERELSGGEEQTTNNRMELTAVLQALQCLKQPCIVELYSDSKYVIDALQKGWAVVWCSVVLAAVGLYFLSIQDGFSLAKGDFYMMLCAIVFAVHILLLDYFTRFVDSVALSCGQFAVTAVLSAVLALCTEQNCWSSIWASIWPILYVGIFSSGVAYTLQIVAIKGSNPAVVSLLLSLESVFAALSGALILHERLSARELLGCGLIFAAVILTQLPQRRKQAASVAAAEKSKES